MNVISLTVWFKSIVDAIARKDNASGFVIRGCVPTPQGAGTLQVNVAAGDYVSGGTLRTYAGGNIIPDAADPVLPRRDLIYFSAAGVLSKLAGVASAAPPPLPPAWPAGACPISIEAIPAAALDYSIGAPNAFVEDVTQVRVDAVFAHSVKAFGAVGDGVADDSAAIQAAIDAANGGRVFFPPGVYRILTRLNLDVDGTELIGSGMTGAKCVIRTGAAINAIRSKSSFGRIADIELDGNGVGLNGLIFWNAGRTVVSRVYAHNFTQDGIRFDIAFAAPNGNNNFIRLEYCRSSANTLRGYAVPTNQSDNNALVFLDCEAQANGGHGLLFKGVGVRIFGGQYSANTGAGIALGEVADGPTTVDGLIIFPWLEGNGAAGGVACLKSVRHRIMTQLPAGGSFTVVPVVGGATADSHEFVTTAGSTGAPTLVVQGEVDGGPLGGIQAGGNIAAVGVIEQIAVVTQNWNPGLLAAGAQIALTIAMPAGTYARFGDTCLVSADVDLQDQQLTAYVRLANSVRVVLRNGTGAGINLGAFNVRVEVVKH